MANTTVIDSLIVKLGLDPRDFDKGSKQAAAAVIKTKKEVKSATDDMSKGAENAAKSFVSAGSVIGKVFSRGGAIGIAIAALIVAGKKINDELYDVAENTRKLGMDARSYNTTASGLRNMQNAAELAGGSLEDATEAAGGLTKSLFDLKFNGAISQQLIQLARLGVQFTDASGNARDFKDVTLDTAAALEKMQRSGQMSRADAIQFAQQSGFAGGMAQLVASGRAATEAALARQEARRQVTGEDVAAGTGWVNANRSMGQAGLANVGVPMMTADANAPGIGGIARNQTGERLIVSGAQIAGEVGDVLSKAVDKASEALGDLADNAKKVVSGFGDAAGKQGGWFNEKYKFRAAIDAAAAKYNIPREVLAGIVRTESGFNPDAIAKDKNGVVTGAGIMQLNPKYFKNAGKNPFNDIDTGASHYADLYSRTSGTEQERHIQALRMYHAGETNFRKGTNLGPANKAYAGKALAGTAYAIPSPNAQARSNGAGGGAQITFEQVNVTTTGADGRAIANDFVGATSRKMKAAHVDRAIN